MAKNEENKKSQKPAGPTNVVSIVIDRCKAEGCKAKATKADFCDEHFIWFKEGLITVDGHQAKDFDKKYQQFIASKKKVA